MLHGFAPSSCSPQKPMPNEGWLFGQRFCFRHFHRFHQRLISLKPMAKTPQDSPDQIGSSFRTKGSALSNAALIEMPWHLRSTYLEIVRWRTMITRHAKGAPKIFNSLLGSEGWHGVNERNTKIPWSLQKSCTGTWAFNVINIFRQLPLPKVNFLRSSMRCKSQRAKSYQVLHSCSYSVTLTRKIGGFSNISFSLHVRERDLKQQLA